MKTPQIILVDNNEIMCNAWREELTTRNLQDKVEVVQEQTKDYLLTAPVASFVLFADSFGLMEDSLCDIFDEQAKEKIREYLLSIWFGELPVGNSCGVPMPQELPCCIYTAYTHFPRFFEGMQDVYHSVRSSLICASHNDLPSILIPMPRAALGVNNYSDIARVMVSAIAQILNPPEKVSLGYAREYKNIV